MIHPNVVQTTLCGGWWRSEWNASLLVIIDRAKFE